MNESKWCSTSVSSIICDYSGTLSFCQPKCCTSLRWVQYLLIATPSSSPHYSCMITDYRQSSKLFPVSLNNFNAKTLFKLVLSWLSVIHLGRKLIKKGAFLWTCVWRWSSLRCQCNARCNMLIKFNVQFRSKKGKLNTRMPALFVSRRSTPWSCDLWGKYDIVWHVN